MISKKAMQHIIQADGVKDAVEAYKNIGATIAEHADVEAKRRKEAHDTLQANRRLMRAAGERERR